MFYAVLVFLIVIVFLLRTDRGSLPARYMTAVLFFYMMALFFLVLYLAKDMYYYNTANYYFALPKSIWKMLTLLNISRTLIIRLCNFSVLAVLWLGVRFSLSFLHPTLERISVPVRRTATGILAAELLFYDPAVFRQIYYALYPDVFSVSGFNTLRDTIHKTTIAANLLLVGLSLCILCYTLSRTSGLQMIRLNMFGVTFSWLLVMVSWLYIFWQYPCPLIKVSRLADTVTFLSAPLISGSFFYRIFPYFLILTLMLISLSTYKISGALLQIRDADFSISRQIAASDITSRTFCHFMKNELLAIEAELDGLELSGENARAVSNVMNRCEHLYERLDSIHRNTRSATLILQKENLRDVMTELLREQLADIDISVTCDYNDACPSVMLDRNYFEQAVMNIITNALEAMQDSAEKHLYVSLSSVGKWVILTIRDTGIGIAPENLKNIFTPFYTSAPVSRHWGIGLSLTHKIIAAHEGHIEVESQKNAGTTFRIILPALR